MRTPGGRRRTRGGACPRSASTLRHPRQGRQRRASYPGCRPPREPLVAGGAEENPSVGEDAIRTLHRARRSELRSYATPPRVASGEVEAIDGREHLRSLRADLVGCLTGRHGGPELL